MKYLNRITADSKQNFLLIGESGEQITFNMYFMPTQKAWFCDIIWNTFEATGIQLVVSPNLLHGWKNILTFGLACTTVDGYDPMYINDFNTGRIQLYLLSSSDVSAIEENIF